MSWTVPPPDGEGTPESGNPQYPGQTPPPPGYPQTPAGSPGYPSTGAPGYPPASGPAYPPAQAPGAPYPGYPSAPGSPAAPQPYPPAGYPGYQQQTGYPGQVPVYGTESWNGLSIAGFVVSIVAFVTCSLFFIGAVAGLGLSIAGFNQINNSPVPVKGKGLAIAGIIIGGLAVLIGILQFTTSLFSFWP